MNLVEAIDKLLMQINKDENEGGLLSRDTHKAAGAVRIAINRTPFVQGQRVNDDDDEGDRLRLGRRDPGDRNAPGLQHDLTRERDL